MTFVQSPRNPVGPSRGHITGLDGLRGIAVIGVLFYHMFPDTVKGGFLGVSIFFILSGWLLAYNEERRYQTRGFSALNFYKNRIRRIYPTLILYILATAGFLLIFARDVLNGIRPEIASILLGVNNYWQIAQNGDYFTRIGSASPFTHMWCLSLEWQFYLIWPILYLIYSHLRRDRKGMVRPKEDPLRRSADLFFPVLALMSMILLEVRFHPGHDVTPVYYGTGTRIFSIFLGSALGVIAGRRQAMLERTGGEKRRSPENFGQAGRRVLIFLVCMIILVVSYFTVDGTSPLTYRFSLIATTLVFCLLLTLSAQEDIPCGGWLDIKPLSILGKYSYECYLWQYPVIFLFRYNGRELNLVNSLLILIIIAVLSVWLHQVTAQNWKETVRELREFFQDAASAARNRKRGKKVMKEKRDSRRLVLQAATCLMAVMVVLGACGTILTPNTKKSDQQTLKKQLSQNESQLKKNQKQAKEAQHEADILKAKRHQAALAYQAAKKAAEDAAKAAEEKGLSKKEKKARQEAAADAQKKAADLRQKYIEARRKAETRNGAEITCIGDSVMLGAAPAIQDMLRGSAVDAKESRQVSQAAEIAKGLENQGLLRKNVIIALGTNGPFTLSQGQTIIDALGDRKIFWVTCYGKHVSWVPKSNRTIRKLAKKNKNVEIIDWNQEGPKHPDWFYSDGIHLTPEGQKGYAKFLRNCLDQMGVFDIKS